ncbi:hypothetical protein [Cyanobium sp. L1E-Cus]|uniref:hypothetical protein n=1 Tax=Cyanobium sp. L1E-Cus TaxID=2823714 RepID=UPI0020CC1295|nr:hypothetical protein [Cyanobium sp. L1E-Cus]
MAADISPLSSTRSASALGSKALGYFGATLALAAAVASVVGVASVAGVGAARAQEKGYGQTISSPQQERELDYGTGTNKGGSALDSANPIDLMNKLRKATSMDNATNPGDAVDAALRDFHSPTAAPASASPAATVKGP